jgi:hypothetical protein
MIAFKYHYGLLHYASYVYGYGLLNNMSLDSFPRYDHEQSSQESLINST